MKTIIFIALGVSVVAIVLYVLLNKKKDSRYTVVEQQEPIDSIELKKKHILTLKAKSKDGYTFEDGRYHIFCDTLESRESFKKVFSIIEAIVRDYEAKKGYETDEHMLMFFYENDIHLYPPASEKFWKPYDNSIFWEKFASHSEYFDLAEEHLAYALEKNKVINEGFNTIWETDMMQFGNAAVFNLALSDKRFISHYCRFLHTWDMYQEGFQSDEISELIKKYDWCPEIEELLIARATCDGHGDYEDLAEWEPFILKHNPELQESKFFKRLVFSIRENWNKDKYAKKLYFHWDQLPAIISKEGQLLNEQFPFVKGE